jgi:hypothetical protein
MMTNDVPGPLVVVVGGLIVLVYLLYFAAQLLVVG